MAGDEEIVSLEDEAVVEVELDTPVEPTVETAPPEPEDQSTEVEVEAPKKPRERVRLKDVQSAAEEAAAALTKSLNEERALRQAAEATALAERQRAEAAARDLQESQTAREQALQQVAAREQSIINSGIEAAKQQLETLEGQLTRQYEAGEFAEAAKTQVSISRATASLAQLEQSKERLDARVAERPATEGRVAPTPPNTPATRFEAYVGQLGPAAQAWLRAHPHCAPPEAGGDATANAKMMAGHHLAVAKGYALSSPEYFREIEAQVAPAAPAAPPTPSPAPPLAARPSPPRAQPSAPPSRDPVAAPGVPRNVRQVTLSKEQQEAAILSFPKMDKKQAFALYAQNLIELEAAGKLGRTTH